jgi:hypothetical protein
MIRLEEKRDVSLVPSDYSSYVSPALRKAAIYRSLSSFFLNAALFSYFLTENLGLILNPGQ